MPTDNAEILKYIRLGDPSDELRRLLLRVTLADQRRRIHRANSLPAKPTLAQRLNRKRFANEAAKKRLRKILGSSRPPISKDVLACRFGDHPVLSEMLPGREHQWKPILKRDRFAKPEVVTIKRLSFLTNPEEALQTIAQLVRAEAHSLNVRVDFDFEFVDDIGPFLLLSEIWPYFSPVFSGGGKMHPAVQKVLEAVGLRHSLGMAFPGLRDLKDVWAMPVQRRRPSGRSRSTDRFLEPQSNELVAGRFCDEVNRWLMASGTAAELTPKGRRELTQIVNELLDNAERHSSIKDKDGSWTTAAFMARRTIDGEERHVCHIAFLSLGDTIKESLEATAPDPLKDKLSGFVQDLQSAGARQSPATLTTLAALQDGVTRDPDAYARSSGGYGLMEFVDSVNIIGLSDRPELQPTISIVSGSSCIQLRAPYNGGSTPGKDARRRQLFNPGNTTDEPPSEHHVLDLPIKLPGTVISVGFTLDQEFYRKALNAGD